MCDPLSATGMVLGVAGGLASMAGQQKAMHARQKAINAENQRQQGFEAQSAAVFNQSLPKAGGDAEAQRRADAEAKRFAEDKAVVEGDKTILQPTGSAPQEVQSTNARALRKAVSQGVDRAKRGAALGAYGDSQSDLSFDLGRAAQWQNIFGGNAIRSSRLLPAELEAANMRGGGLKALGAVLGTAGSAAGAWGSGANSPSWNNWGSIFGRSAPYGATGAGYSAISPGGRLVGGV